MTSQEATLMIAGVAFIIAILLGGIASNYEKDPAVFNPLIAIAATILGIAGISLLKWGLMFIF